MRNQRKRNISRAATINETAEVVGVTPSMVRKTLATDRNNEVVENVFMFITEGKNQLLEEAKKLVPFND